VRTSTALVSSLARRVASTVTTPLVPGDYLDMVAPLRAGGDLRGRVLEVVPETPDAVTVVIRPSRGWAGHLPGQYVRIGVDVDGVRRWRAYSLTSESHRRDVISVTVKAIPDGVVSGHITRSLVPGTLLQLDQAVGEFTLGEHRGPTLFLTAGSGVTPVMGMLRNYLDELTDVVVVHSAPDADAAIFGDELRRLHEHGRIRLVERHTDTDGVLAPADLDAHVPDWDRREAWACGPVAMLDDLEQHWAAAGIGPQLHTERFRPTVVAAGEGGTLSFTRSDAVVEADGATTLLDAGEAAGVLMPSGCRMGICFGCVAGLQEGTVRDLRNGEATTATPDEEVRIQTCVSAAAGPCRIDL